MATPSPFVEHVLDMLRDFGTVTAKPMFGAWGLFSDGVFFALVAQDTLYLKADSASDGEFAALALEPFVYESRVDQHIVTSYRRAPDEALENVATMATWARRGLDAALRTRGAKGNRRRKTAV